MDDFQHLDDYALLGVSPGAQPEDIKQAYRREIAKYHPDRFRHADPQMQQYAQQRSQRITEAYAALNRNPRARSQPRRVQPMTSAEQLAADYQQAQTLLATGAAAEAARLLRQIQRVDPFYRDVGDLLARAESLSGGTAERRSSRKAAAWATGGALALLLLGGGVYGWNTLRSSEQAQQSPTGTPGAIAGANPSDAAGAIAGANPGDAAAATATATPLVVADAPTAVSASAPAASEAAGGTLPTVETLPTTAPPPTEVPPPPTEVPTQPPTPVPPTEVPPTQAPPPPTEVPPRPTAVPPRPTQPPAPAPTQPPAPQRVVGVESGAVLDGDNFGNPASGWPTLQQPAYTLGYRDGTYVITSQPNTGAIFAYGSPLSQSNAIIGADVIPVRGSAGLNFGPDNSYRFVISANGQFRVEQRGRVIVRPTASSAIRAGRNRLVLAVVGTRASVYANGTLLANLNVPAPLAGTTYGFVVIPGPNGGEGIFDSLTVRTLPR